MSGEKKSQEYGQDATESKRNGSISSLSSRSTSTSVETIVTKLLMSTKHLLQTLTQWSKQAVTQKDVSDAYVQLGNDFKVVSKFFTHCGIDVRDLGDVPMDLRRVLEVALREKPSDNNLNKYLPSIREIIVKLLDKLKVKQALLKSMKQEQSLRAMQHQQRPSVVSSLSLSSASTPSRSSNLNGVNASPNESKAPAGQFQQNEKPRNGNYSSPDLLSPAHPSKQRVLSENEALTRLKQGSDLQRRASKRFSAYHMAKFTNQATSDASEAALPSVPTSAQSNPLPVRAVAEADGKAINNADIANLPTASRTADGTLFTLFLSMDGQTKKCRVPKPANINALKLLFVEKFAYSPGGDTFPELYMKDKDYNVSYELDEHAFSDLDDGCIVELRQHDLRTPAPSNPTEWIQSVKEEIHKNNNELLKQMKNLIANSQVAALPSAPKDDPAARTSPITQSSLNEMKKEISVLRQLQTENRKNLKVAIAAITEELSKFQTLSPDSNSSSNRVYIGKSQEQLGQVSDSLLSRVDDLQDLIEILRKDVAVRGAKPSRKKLDSVQKDLKAAQDDLQKMHQFIAAEKPHWKKIWEAELDKVCEEQQFLTLQEDLAADLEEDLGKAIETFDLVNLCCVEQEKNPKRSKTNPILPVPKPGTLNRVRDQLLSEVQSLNPDHEGRAEALEKAEKLWLKEKEYRDTGEFEEELENFVEKSSFKRSGGVEEVERLRRQKDEENLRANFGGLPV
ncbi:hypothetical protein HG536_0C03770 [Torulaspora globosa]|uniref:Actin interacting protein 3 C-terminal domain-containing protein n=1 Tax=Torulaspora globosa TaxID=48254 RepID=A0A7G3ZFC2_9SACH|nr:uncharacterized protein HG536_0C03770 [Torulaspora globosa]QLL32208.1 hypothetical protein HG536_0C03770 [Torulaspora globosa]